jgi:hypothetical protein
MGFQQVVPDYFRTFAELFPSQKKFLALEVCEFVTPYPNSVWNWRRASESIPINLANRGKSGYKLYLLVTNYILRLQTLFSNHRSAYLHGRVQFRTLFFSSGLYSLVQNFILLPQHDGFFAAKIILRSRSWPGYGAYPHHNRARRRCSKRRFAEGCSPVRGTRARLS